MINIMCNRIKEAKRFQSMQVHERNKKTQKRKLSEYKKNRDTGEGKGGSVGGDWAGEGGLAYQSAQ